MAPAWHIADTSETTLPLCHYSCAAEVLGLGHSCTPAVHAELLVASPLPGSVRRNADEPGPSLHPILCATELLNPRVRTPFSSTKPGPGVTLNHFLKFLKPSPHSRFTCPQTRQSQATIPPRATWDFPAFLPAGPHPPAPAAPGEPAGLPLGMWHLRPTGTGRESRPVQMPRTGCGKSRWARRTLRFSCDPRPAGGGRGELP